MGGSHAVFVIIAAVLLPCALEISGSNGNLVGGGADDGVKGDPIRAWDKKISARVNWISPRRHLFQGAEMLFTAAAGIIDLIVLVVSDLRKKTRIEKSAVVCELRQLVAIAESATLMRNRKGQREDIARSERPIKRVDGVQIARSAAYQVEWPIELNIGGGLLLVRDVNL